MLGFAEKDLKIYASAYNALDADVEAVYDKFEGLSAHDEIIRGALQIIRRHDVHTYLAITLLHRHFNCESGEVFIEEKYTPDPDHQPVLVTVARQFTNFKKKIYPHRFKLGSAGKIQPLEFTTDPTIGRVYEKLAHKHALFRELHTYLKKNGVSDILGVGIYVRKGISKSAPRVFLEETKFESRESIVHVLPQLPRQVGRAIPTLWTFGENAYGCCRGQCVAYCSHSGPPGMGYCGHRRSGGHMICV